MRVCLSRVPLCRERSAGECVDQSSGYAQVSEKKGGPVKAGPRLSIRKREVEPVARRGAEGSEQGVAESSLPGALERSSHGESRVQAALTGGDARAICSSDTERTGDAEETHHARPAHPRRAHHRRLG